MKQENKNQKKLSLKKLQMVKIKSGLNLIKGGSAVGGGGNDTVFDNTDAPGGNGGPLRPRTQM